MCFLEKNKGFLLNKIRWNKGKVNYLIQTVCCWAAQSNMFDFYHEIIKFESIN